MGNRRCLILYLMEYSEDMEAKQKRSGDGSCV